MAVFTVLASLFTSAHASDLPSCDFGRELIHLAKNEPGAAAPRAHWSKHVRFRYLAAQRAADAVFTAYRSGNWVAGSLVGCGLAKSELAELEISIPVRFFELTMREIERSNMAGIRNFARAIRSRSEGGNILAYRLVGHLPGASNPTKGAGGYHRGHQSIFMDFEQTPREQWTIIFIHELLHALDQQLTTGMQNFGDRELREKIDAIRGSGKNYAQLSVGEQNDLQRWLIAGLDRGYLAEARAWSVTFTFYRQLRAENRQVTLPWLEKILAERKNKKGQPENDFRLALRYLDQKFTNPTEDDFRSKIISEALEATRESIRRGEILVELGGLADYLAP